MARRKQRRKGIEWRGIVREEGVMKSDDDSPSFVDILRFLWSSVDCAEDFALNHPEHADAVSRFVQELRRIKKELMTSFEETSRPASLHDIRLGLMGAKAMVSLMAERHPERSGPLSRFEE